MRRRPPFTVVAFIGLILAEFVAGFIYSGADAGVLLGALILSPFLAGLWFQVRAVWIFIVAVVALSLVSWLAAREWGPAATIALHLVLLLSPPTRRYFRRDPNRGRKPRAGRSRRGRAIRLGAVGLVWLTICLV